MFYEGARNEERLVRVDITNKWSQFFEGAEGKERKVRKGSDHAQFYYEGAHKEERLVRVEYLNQKDQRFGLVVILEKDKGMRRVIYIEDADGVILRCFDGHFYFWDHPVFYLWSSFSVRMLFR